MSQIITDHNDPKIKKFLGLKGINKDTYIIGEGFRVVEKMNNTLGVNEVLTSKKIFEENKEFFERIDGEIHLASDDFISSHVGYKFHQGLFAISDHPGYKDINTMSGHVLILNNLDNAENVGALIRSALGLGFNNILVDAPTCSPYLKRAIRVSMGNVFFANIFRSENLCDGIALLQEKGYEVFSAANEESAVSYRNIDSTKKDIGIIIGNEGNGITQEVKSASSNIVKIPVKEEVEHLNAAAAGAILMSYFSSF